MGCLSTTQIAEYQAQLTTLTENLTAINAAIFGGTLNVKMYTFDSGEGKQSVTYQKITELFEVRDLIQSQIKRINHILRGTGLVNLNLRRK